MRSTLYRQVTTRQQWTDAKAWQTKYINKTNDSQKKTYYFQSAPYFVFTYIVIENLFNFHKLLWLCFINCIKRHLHNLCQTPLKRTGHHRHLTPLTCSLCQTKGSLTCYRHLSAIHAHLLALKLLFRRISVLLQKPILRMLLLSVAVHVIKISKTGYSLH